MRIYQALIISFLSLSFCAVVSAQQFNLDRHAGLVGQYIISADLNEKINRSECGQYIKNKNPLTLAMALAEVRKKFHERLWLKLMILLTRKNLLAGGRNTAGQRKRDVPQHFAHEGFKDRSPEFDCIFARGQGLGLPLQAPSQGDAFAPRQCRRDRVR